MSDRAWTPFRGSHPCELDPTLCRVICVEQANKKASDNWLSVSSFTDVFEVPVWNLKEGYFSGEGDWNPIRFRGGSGGGVIS